VLLVAKRVNPPLAKSLSSLFPGVLGIVNGQDPEGAALPALFVQLT
jgi:hypothetical protein